MVKKYIDLLEKCYVIFTLNAFSKNLRKMRVKNPLFYFDNDKIAIKTQKNEGFMVYKFMFIKEN